MCLVEETPQTHKGHMMQPNQHPAILLPPALAAIAEKGRDHLDTIEFSVVFACKPQTVRKNHCATGECYGIRPTKAGNKLLWPIAAVAKKLQGGVK